MDFILYFRNLLIKHLTLFTEVKSYLNEQINWNTLSKARDEVILSYQSLLECVR